MARKYHQGKFIPKNPKKYRGDVSKITYRSSWELNLFIKCDTNKNILQWNSEEVVIPYFSNVDNKNHRYFMDVWLKMKNKQGKVVESLIEVKPYLQTQPPKKGKRKTKGFISSQKTYATNIAKWKAANKYAAKRGMSFKLLTEKGLFDFTD